jgi:hypothetical protein
MNPESRFFKHGTMVKFTLTSGGDILEESVIPIDSLGGAVTRCGVMYNRLAVSGGVSWRNPGTGQPIQKPKWTWELVDPSDELFDGAFCDCADCERAA